MSLSPTAERPTELASYELGWVAVHRMLREGKSWSGREEDCSYLNTGDGRFANVSAVTGLDSADDTRGAARVDWDLDGRTDLWVAGRNSPRVRLYLNRAKLASAWLDLRLSGTSANRDAVGARVEVVLGDGKRHVQTLRAGEGYLAQSSKWLHFGLGSAAKIEKVLVRWPAPGKGLEEFSGLEPGARFTLSEGTGRAQRWDPPGGSATLATAPAKPLAPTEKARIALAARLPLPPLPIVLADKRVADARGGIEPPLLIVLWSTTCPPCLAELGELAERADDVRAAGLSVLALSVEDESRRGAALDYLKRVQWEFHAGFATLDALESLDALQRTLTDRRRRTPVPASFLVDPERKLAYVYKGPLAVDTLLADAGRLRAHGVELRDAAVPFAGLWRSAPPQPDLGALELAYAERGLEAAADEVAQARIQTRQQSRASLLNDMGMVRARQGKLDEAVASFREALAQEPDFVAALVNLATALQEQLRPAEAVPYYEQALRIDPRNVTAIFNLALARCQLGRPQQARGELEQLDVLAPERAAKVREVIERLRTGAPQDSRR